MNMYLVLDNAVGSFPNNLVIITEDRKVAEDFVNEYKEYLKRSAKKVKIQNDLILIKNRIPVPVKNKLFTGILEQCENLEMIYGKYISFDADKMLSLEKANSDSELKYTQELVVYESQCLEAVAEYFKKNPDSKEIFESVEPIRQYHNYAISSVNVNNGIIV